MMEKLGEPQTHLALKEMIREVDEDEDNKISFREVKAISFVSVPQASVKSVSTLFTACLQG